MTTKSHQPLSEHTAELRLIIIKILLIVGAGTAISLIFYRQIFSILSSPFYEMIPVLTGQEQFSSRLILLSPEEGITSILKACFWTGLLTSSPIWLLLILRFVVPGLKFHEKRLILPFTIGSLLSLALGFTFAYYITIPMANHYLFALNETLGPNLWSLSSYLDYSILLMCANGLAFEFFNLLFFCVHYGLITADSLKEKRKTAIVTIFIASAILTPPDAVTQLLLAIPLALIYEANILYAMIIRKRFVTRSKPLM